jgi:hypothetical protein
LAVGLLGLEEVEKLDRGYSKVWLDKRVLGVVAHAM